jgi:hypothetical protein
MRGDKMLKFALLWFALAAGAPLWSQVEPSASGGDLDLGDSHMMTPPPVSQDSYPSAVGSEARSNFLSGGVLFTAAYVDNLMEGNSAVPDETYYIFPTIGFDRRTARQSESISYSPGFELYQHTSQLNGISQNGFAGYRYHLSPYASINLGDSFQQNYNLFNQGNPFSAGGISGAAGSPDSAQVAPFENQLTNTSSAGVDYQYGKSAMVGASGSYSHLQYSNQTSTTGLNESGVTSASAFYNRRLSRSQYVGVVYEFSKGVTHPDATYTVTNAIQGFYTYYFTRSFSVSILGGPEDYTTWAPLVPHKNSWTPAVQGSFGWQISRASISANYSYIVSGAGGLSGTYRATLANVNARASLARTWTVSGNTSYSNFDSVLPSEANSGFGVGGRTISAGASVEHRLTARMSVNGGYQYFHEDYPDVVIASKFPNSNREYISISYQFDHPLGR